MGLFRRCVDFFFVFTFVCWLRWFRYLVSSTVSCCIEPKRIACTLNCVYVHGSVVEADVKCTGGTGGTMLYREQERRRRGGGEGVRKRARFFGEE